MRQLDQQAAKAVIARQGLRGEQQLDLRHHSRSGVFISGLYNYSDPRTSFRAERFFAHSLARRAGKQVKSGTEYAILAGNVADTFWDTFPPPGTPHHQGLKLGGLVRCSLVRCSLVIGGDVGLTVVVTL